MNRFLRIFVPAFLPLLSIAQDSNESYVPISGAERASWVVKSTLSPATLLFTGFDAGLGTLRNSPRELGPHWNGYGDRYGLRIADRALSTSIEAGVGALWGEDPRYRRVPEKPFAGRIAHVLKMTVVSHDASGREMPAYARFVAVPAAAFISNAWKPDSQNSSGDALNRIGFSVATHILGNAYTEFWPDARARFFHHGPKGDPVTGITDSLR